MDFSIVDVLIIFQNIISLIMLFLSILLWIKKKNITNILFFMIVLFIYIQLLFKALSFYHILNIEVMVKINNLSLINYLVDFVVLVLVFFFIVFSIRFSCDDEDNTNNDEK